MTNHVDLEGMEVLTLAECLTLLAHSRIGRVGFVVAGIPKVLPVNFNADADGSIVFRTAATSILKRIAGQSAAFETDGYDERHRSGWSVCVQGVGREITEADDPAARRLQQLTVITWVPGRRDRWLTITPDEVTGRRIPLSLGPSDFGWVPGVVS